MEPARSLAHYIRAPADRYFAGRSWLHFCKGDDVVSGLLFWGETSASELPAFERLHPVRGQPLGRAMPRFADVRRVTSTTAHAFAQLARDFQRDRAFLRDCFTRVAVVHAGGVGMGLALGLVTHLASPFPLELFTDPIAALAWLGIPEPPRLGADLEMLQARATGTTPLLRDLGAVLGASLTHASLASAARALGLSTRSLQRRLADEGSSFQREATRARVLAAQGLLRDTDEPLAEVAGRVGCASPSHFAKMFRAATGTPPARWRVQHRSRP